MVEQRSLAEEKLRAEIDQIRLSTQVLKAKQAADLKRAGLELDKLALDVRELKTPWWSRPTFLTSVTATLITILTAVYALTSGFFGAQSAKLEAETALLDLQKERATEEVDRLNGEKATLEAEIGRLRDDLLAREALLAEQPVKTIIDTMKRANSLSWDGGGLQGELVRLVATDRDRFLPLIGAEIDSAESVAVAVQLAKIAYLASGDERWWTRFIDLGKAAIASSADFTVWVSYSDFHDFMLPEGLRLPVQSSNLDAIRTKGCMFLADAFAGEYGAPPENVSGSIALALTNCASRYGRGDAIPSEWERLATLAANQFAAGEPPSYYASTYAMLVAQKSAWVGALLLSDEWEQADYDPTWLDSLQNYAKRLQDQNETLAAENRPTLMILGIPTDLDGLDRWREFHDMVAEHLPDIVGHPAAEWPEFPN